jgi:hypothetical protein
VETANIPHRLVLRSVLATGSLTLLAVIAFAQATPPAPAGVGAVPEWSAKDPTSGDRSPRPNAVHRGWAARPVGQLGT